jgi:Ca-activated chloride channel family protein
MAMVVTTLATRVCRSAAAAALVLAALLASTGAAVRQPTFRAETDVVSFGVTVTDRRGNFVTDLTDADFEILEDGRAQTVAYFARGDGAGGAAVMHVGLLFDTSGSMTQDIQLARTAAIRFLNTLSEARDITLVDFDTEIRVAKYEQQDFPRLVERIRGRKPQGLTAMYDALGLYLDGADRDEGRTILVIFTDGGDTRSMLRFSDAMTLIRASDVTVYAVGFLEHQRSGDRSQQRLQLSQLAAESGGEAFFPLSMKEIDAAYDKILAQIRAQYSLGFISSNTVRDGAWRKVEIKVRRPDLKDLRVQTRRGYFAPYRPPGPDQP